MARFIRVLRAKARERQGKGEGKARERQSKASRPSSTSRWPGTGGGLTPWAPAVSFGTTLGISGTFRGGADDGSIHFSGAGLPGGWDGQGAGGGVSGGTGGVRRGRRRARRKAHGGLLGRSGRNPATHRKRPAGIEGGFDRNLAGAGVRSRLLGPDACRIRGGTFARRIFRARRRRAPQCQ